MTAINKTITYDLPDELWKEVKDYAGIFPVNTNIANFDKLTFEELEETLEDYNNEYNNPFSYVACGDTVYNILVTKHHNEYVCGTGKYYYCNGEVIKATEKKEMVVKYLKKKYRRIKHIWSDESGWVCANHHRDRVEFWESVSRMITYHFKKRDEAKAAAKKKRAAAKAVKETPKGIIAEINKIEGERRRLIKRMKDDQEKLNKLTTKGREWRTRLDNSKNQHS